ncbi:hypothetical protein AVEN_249924-1 [Araneus ventricosus]|uniref:Uncharacterized protein n=1 Tax=Araneus ventricosus TaxID=182803 RepID=A0A4Y2E0F3_ARAVE|nr:hypothetical protein AVEN_249924-1 [Araneus ventricosus]
MTRTVPEPAPSWELLRHISEKTFDFAYTVVLQLNQVSKLESSSPEAEMVPVGHRCPEHSSEERENNFSCSFKLLEDKIAGSLQPPTGSHILAFPHLY